MADDDLALGRREVSKRASRAALRAAADRLFAERGFAKTTVQDIAADAGVTPRTFFRYFAFKEDLVLDDALSWLPTLTNAIRARPAGEPPLVTIEQALAHVAALLAAADRPTPLWLFTDGPPAARLRPRTPDMPLLRLEQEIADALRDRLGAPTSDAANYRCDILSRVAVAALHSAVIRDWQPARTREAATEPPVLALMPG